MPFAVLVLALLVGGLVLLLALNTASAANELATSRLQDADTGVSARVESLQTDIADRSAPDALAAAARQLGMVPAPRPAFLEIDGAGSVRLRGRPVAVTAGPLSLTPAEAIAERVRAEQAAAARARKVRLAREQAAARAKACRLAARRSATSGGATGATTGGKTSAAEHGAGPADCPTTKRRTATTHPTKRTTEHATRRPTKRSTKRTTKRTTKRSTAHGGAAR